MSIFYRLLWDVVNAEGRRFPVLLLSTDACFPDGRSDALALYGALSDTCSMNEHIKKYQRIRLRGLSRKTQDEQISYAAWLEAGWPVDEKSIKRQVLGTLTQGADVDAKLSDRQVEVLRAIVNGKTSKELAQELNISVRTAEFHRAALMSKINARTVADVVRYALERGIE